MITVFIMLLCFSIFYENQLSQIDFFWGGGNISEKYLSIGKIFAYCLHCIENCFMHFEILLSLQYSSTYLGLF